MSKIKYHLRILDHFWSMCLLYTMSTSSSASGIVPTTLVNIPVEIYYQVISSLNKGEKLKHRLVCREDNDRTLYSFDPHIHASKIGRAHV